MEKGLKYCLLIFNFISIAVYSAEEIDLGNYERSIYSQQGEDGVIEELFNLIPPTSHFYLEFGGFDGITTSNVANLRDKKWSGVQWDGDHENVGIGLYKEFITAENIGDLLAKYNVPEDIDFVSIDIDFNDFYVWRAFPEKYRPKVVCIECNATHYPQEDLVVFYDPNGRWDGGNYYGASVLALYKLGKMKGYTLVYMENNGVNLFFLRNDLIDSLGLKFKNMGNVDALYKKPRYGGHGAEKNGGHHKDTKDRIYTSAGKLLNQ